MKNYPKIKVPGQRHIKMGKEGQSQGGGKVVADWWKR